MVRGVASALALAVAAVGASTARAACDDLLPAASATGTVRDITTRDLVRLRDVGEPDVTDVATSPYALSPDGRSLAFVITRGDPVSNSVCSALVSIPAHGDGRPRILDRGGSPPVFAGNFRGLFIATGFPDQITPLWSPDGRSIAWRKLVDGVAQLARTAVDGSGATQVTHGPVDVVDFAWTPDRAAIVYTARASQVAAERAIDREGETGWRYDARTVPNISWRPNPWVRDLPIGVFRVELATGTAREATAAEQALVVPPPAPDRPFDLAAESGSGARAWTEPVSPHPIAEHRLWAADSRGRKTACRLAGCTGRISRIFWDRRSIIFLTRAGWRGEDVVLYRWVPGSNRLTTILRTSDSLSGCIQARADLICGRENASAPRRIVAIDLRTGRDRLIFDPNPEFAQVRLGRVERLRFSNDRGLPSWGDLVLPPGYDGKARLPLIIVTYHSRGFLRGGTGDEYPIFPLAAKGFAVLSFERPPEVAVSVPGLTSWDGVLTELQRDWAERRSVQSALMTGIDTAVATGKIDPARIGITGLSDGASIVEFALVNSKRFAAAAMSTCCDDRLTSLVLGGEAWGGENRRSGYPRSVDNDRAYWTPISLSVNARAITTPILFQLADREAHLALESYGALREAGKPVEMHVYPQEFHNKVQPIHRLAVYDRNIDWFAFWLRGYEDPVPEKRAQYERWERFRAAPIVVGP
ncbi:Atxe2 family lasso peptide isopeptidase [Sphingomonas sp. ERG5]|uniref:Atxe2 family lasso peptide isopeptidase n=1 Tax=Sphingomonas sp. ERG5 TaxID=1381597 RepID=UPI00054BA84E|nr:Atxe2 family lasso peptide isopeptidase [Sphingomonas sp. ERG5]